MPTGAIKKRRKITKTGRKYKIIYKKRNEIRFHNIYKTWKKDLYIYVDPKSDLILPGSIVCGAKRKSKVFKKYIDIPDTTVSFEDFEKIGYVDYLIDPIIDDFLLHSIWREHDKTTYLTNRPIDTLIMKSLEQNDFATQNTLNYIKPILPLIENVNIENLLKIRDNDYDSFLVYRDKLREIIQINNLKTEKDYQDAYSDLIQPEINKMNNILHKNRNHLIKKLE